MKDRGAKRILVVDDDEGVRCLCSDLLGAEGYMVEEASDGAGALEKLMRCTYDLVIADIKMPGLGGLDLYRRIRNECPYLGERFLFMTGRNPEEMSPETFLSLMCRRLLRKPFAVSELLTHTEEITSLPLEEVFRRRSMDRRRQRRHGWRSACLIHGCVPKDAAPREARVENVSRNGLLIVCSGEAPPPGEEMDIHIEKLNVRSRATVVWSGRKGGGESCSGLHIESPLDVSFVDAEAHTRGTRPQGPG